MATKMKGEVSWLVVFSTMHDFDFRRGVWTRGIREEKVRAGHFDVCPDAENL